MTVNPILPIWVMAIICVVLLLFKRKGLIPFLRQIIIVILLFAINLRVMVPDENHVIRSPKINAYVVLVMDNTLSMCAVDMPDGQKRQEVAKESCEYLIDNLPGASFSLITFDNLSHVLSTYTNNPSHIKSMIKTVRPPQETYAKGSSFNLVQDVIQDQVKVARDKEDTNVYVFFLSDGENNKDDKVKTYGNIAKDINGGAVLGFGTPKGGEMMIEVSTSKGLEERKLVTSDGTPGISKLDEKNLNKIASDMNVGYVNVKSTSDLDDIINGIMENVEMTEEESVEVAQAETYYYFLPPLAVMLLWDFFYFKRKV